MNIRSLTLLSALLLVTTALVSAEKAYTWIDENGTRHFSEEPPIDDAIAADQIDLLPAPSAGIIGGENDFYSVVNQADRMQKKRLENEKLMAERLKAESENQQLLNQAQPAAETTAGKDTQDYTGQYPAYPQHMNSQQPPARYNKPHAKKPGEPEELPAYKPKAVLNH